MMTRWRGTPVLDGATSVSAAVSVIVHGAVIVASAIATADPHLEVRDEPEVNIARFLLPPNRVARSEAQPELIRFTALTEPLIKVPVPDPRPVESRPADERPLSFDLQDAPAKADLAGDDSVFTEIEVDSAASRYTWSAAPAYPPAMLTARREGYVKARWVVDEDGLADTTSFVLLEFTSQEFALAVRDALPRMRFSPAKIGSKRVRQLVEQQFAFRINTVLVPETKKPPER